MIDEIIKNLEYAKERLKDEKLVLRPSPPLLMPYDVMTAIVNLRNEAAKVVAHADEGVTGISNLHRAIEEMDKWL